MSATFTTLIKVGVPKHCHYDVCQYFCDIMNTRHEAHFRECIHVCVVPSGWKLLLAIFRHDEKNQNTIQTAFVRPIIGENGSTYPVVSAKQQHETALLIFDTQTGGEGLLKPGRKVDFVSSSRNPTPLFK